MATEDVHLAHVRGLDDTRLANLVKALALDIPRMQGLLAIARREKRKRAKLARTP